MDHFHDGLVGLLIHELKPYLKERNGKLYYNGMLMGVPSAVKLLNKERICKGLGALSYPGVEV